MFYIITGTIVLLAALGMVIIVYYNKFQYSIIKIDEAENNIDIFLLKKSEFIYRADTIIKEKTKASDNFLDMEDIKKNGMNHFETNDFLRNSYLELNKLIDEHDNLLKHTSLTDILAELNDNEEDLVAGTKYYNDSVSEFNRLISTFPSNIIRLFMHLKRKEFYSNEKKEIYEILKEK